MDQTKSIKLQKKRLESAEERARARASSACAQTRWLLCVSSSFTFLLFFLNLQHPNVNTKIQGVGSLAM